MSMQIIYLTKDKQYFNITYKGLSTNTWTLESLLKNEIRDNVVELAIGLELDFNTNTATPFTYKERQVKNGWDRLQKVYETENSIKFNIQV